MTAIYIATVVMMVTYVDVSASDSTCTATYVTAAVFWVLVKTLLHLWFNEKVRRYPTS